MTSTRMRQLIHAPRERVYDALVDPSAVSRWKFPHGMTCHVHEFDARGGHREDLVDVRGEGSSGKRRRGRTDTYRGRFVRLLPNELVVEADEFETDDPAFRGEMMITITLADADEGTELLAVHDGLPDGVSPADNEAGRREALARLAALVEPAGGRPLVAHGPFSSSCRGAASLAPRR